MSKKITVNSNFYYGVISFLKQDLNLTEVAEKFHISKQLLNYYTKPLKHHNIIKKLGKVWLINEKKVSLIDNIKNLELVKKIQMGGSYNNLFTNKPNQIRSHAYQFTIRIPEIKNWHKRFNFLEKKHQLPYQIKGGCGFIYKHHKTHLFSKCIRIYYPKGLSYYSEKPLNAFLHAFYDCKMLVKGLEKLFSNISLTINKEYWIKPTKHHYSLIHNSLAKHLEEQGKKLMIRNALGKVWMLIDNSFNFHEIEFIDPKKNIQHATDFQKNFNYLEEHPTLFQDLDRNHNELLLRVKNISDDLMNVTMLIDQLKNYVKKKEKK